jgi:type IV pilus assembly protein PilQ
MIGGLMRDEDSKTTDRIPWFGRIPVLGFFFRNKVDTSRKAELAIFLTCKIVRFADSSPSSDRPGPVS